MRRKPDEIDEAVFEYGKLVSLKSTGRRPNPAKRRRKRWLKVNPPGSPARVAWEGKKGLDARLKYLLDKE